MHSNPVHEVMRRQNHEEYVENLKDGRIQRATVFKTSKSYKRKKKYPERFEDD